MKPNIKTSSHKLNKNKKSKKYKRIKKVKQKNTMEYIQVY